MAKGLPDDAMGAQSARAFLERTIERWRLLRPGLDVDIAFDGTETGRLAVDATLPQAFANLLNNAADASSATGSSEVGVEARLDGDRLLVRVLDRGPGPASVRSDTAAVPSRGLGLGLLISNATIERFGGSVRQFVRDGGGCVTEIELPLLRDGVGQAGR
jgi:two-component system sensor histidine kinase RegB